jgi:hypothetical protein
MSELSPLLRQELTSPTLPDRFIQCPIDRSSPNSKRLGDGRRAYAVLLERPHL